MILGMVALIAGCDQLASPVFGGVGGSTSTSGFVVQPNKVQLTIGGTVQLATTSQDAIQWSSLSPSVAAVSPSGLVTALTVGTAVIQARSAVDTTQLATSVITVVGAGTVDTANTGG
jgi:hypothetical protein